VRSRQVYARYQRPREPLFPPPNLLGAPQRFAEWRAFQDQAIWDASEADARFVMQVVPTGAGKSLIYTMLAVLLKARTMVLTRTKALQDQLTRDFASIGLKSIKGMNAYVCNAMQPGGELYGIFGQQQIKAGHIIGCDEGPCRVGAHCTLKSGGCDYYDDVERVKQAALGVSNYTYWMHQHKHGKGLGKYDLLVLDEAHDAPDALSEFLTVSLEAWQLAKMGAQPLDGDADYDQWAQWAGHYWVKIAGKAEQLAMEIRQAHSERRRVNMADVGEARILGQLSTILDTIRKMDSTWVCYTRTEPKKQWVFTPAWPAPWAEKSLFLGIPRIILTSATVRPKTAHYLGIQDKDLHLTEYPAIFPAGRRPVVHIPTARVVHTWEHTAQRRWLARIDQILAARPDRKGIIHTVSYARAKQIYLNSEHRERMITHSTEGTRLAITKFKQADQDSGKVLVSPSVTTGYDFPYEECEFQIIVKIPFPDSRDPVLKARQASDAEYGMYQTLQTLVQECGRGMRAEDDYCETFIIDDLVKWAVWRHKHLVPEWFLGTLKTVEVIPAPPPRINRKRAGDTEE
jgi:Rad3-related DNA helicase